MKKYIRCTKLDDQLYDVIFFNDSTVNGLENSYSTYTAGRKIKGVSFNEAQDILYDCAKQVDNGTLAQHTMVAVAPAGTYTSTSTYYPHDFADYIQWIHGTDVLLYGNLPYMIKRIDERLARLQEY